MPLDILSLFADGDGTFQVQRSLRVASIPGRLFSHISFASRALSADSGQSSWTDNFSINLLVAPQPSWYGVESASEGEHFTSPGVAVFSLTERQVSEFVDHEGVIPEPFCSPHADPAHMLISGIGMRMGECSEARPIAFGYAASDEHALDHAAAL